MRVNSLRSKWKDGKTRDSLKSDAITEPDDNSDFKIIKKIGSGAFGVIWSVEMNDGRKLSLKKVLQDPRYKNRELSIIQELNHKNCIKLIEFKQIKESGNLYLELFTELFPTDLHKYLLEKQVLPTNLIKIFGYQLFNGLSYIHSIGITHRDIKSSNILIDPETGRLQICDFGSAKKLLPDEYSVSYISTRCYRAPELLYGSEYYTSQIDIWAAGCVMCEMYNNGNEVFSASSNYDLIEIIIKAIGHPTEEDFDDMKATQQIGQGKQKPLHISLHHQFDEQFYDLLQKIFVYSPKKRITAEEAKNHPFFEGVTEGKLLLPNGNPFSID